MSKLTSGHLTTATATIEEEVRRHLLDEFSQQLLTGALRVISDNENPIRLNSFAAAIRELFSHTLHTLAPDRNVIGCSWYHLEPDARGPTRRQRAKYATQGGLSDKLIAVIGINVADLHKELIDAINQLNKYTHVRPGVIVDDQTEVDNFVKSALHSLLELFSSFEQCRDTLLHSIYDHIDREVTNAFISDTIASIDELSTHHSIEEASIDDLKILAIDDSYVSFEARGSLGVELYWGSRSDFSRGDGVTSEQNYPFTVTMSSPVDDITAFEEVDYSIEIPDWYYDRE